MNFDTHNTVGACIQYKCLISIVHCISVSLHFNAHIVREWMAYWFGDDIKKSGENCRFSVLFWIPLIKVKTTCSHSRSRVSYIFNNGTGNETPLKAQVAHNIARPCSYFITTFILRTVLNNTLASGNLDSTIYLDSFLEPTCITTTYFLKQLTGMFDKMIRQSITNTR